LRSSTRALPHRLGPRSCDTRSQRLGWPGRVREEKKEGGDRKQSKGEKEEGKKEDREVGTAVTICTNSREGTKKVKRGKKEVPLACR